MSRTHALAAMVLASLASCTGFGEVRPDVFRSPQPSEARLAQLIDDHEIRTVVCLRGDSAPTRASARAALAFGADFWRVPMSATRAPRPETLLELWRVADEAKRPLLLHCRAGVDRTGLAAAIVVLHDTGDLDLARGQLAFVPYGHIAWFATGAMDHVLDLYEPHAATTTFPDWVKNVYAPAFAAKR